MPSSSACSGRIRVINGYRAQLDANALGLGFSALVFVTLREGDSQGVGAFEAAVLEIPQIIEAQRLFGEPDYLLRVLVTCLLSDSYTTKSLRVAERSAAYIDSRHEERGAGRPLP